MLLSHMNMLASWQVCAELVDSLSTRILSQWEPWSLFLVYYSSIMKLISWNTFVISVLATLLHHIDIPSLPSPDTSPPFQADLGFRVDRADGRWSVYRSCWPRSGSPAGWHCALGLRWWTTPGSRNRNTLTPHRTFPSVHSYSRVESWAELG